LSKSGSKNKVYTKKFEEKKVKIFCAQVALLYNISLEQCCRSFDADVDPAFHFDEDVNPDADLSL
jgi:hypothetical protein